MRNPPFWCDFIRTYGKHTHTHTCKVTPTSLLSCTWTYLLIQKKRVFLIGDKVLRVLRKSKSEWHWRGEPSHFSGLQFQARGSHSWWVRMGNVSGNCPPATFNSFHRLASFVWGFPLGVRVCVLCTCVEKCNFIKHVIVCFVHRPKGCHIGAVIYMLTYYNWYNTVWEVYENQWTLALVCISVSSV